MARNTWSGLAWVVTALVSAASWAGAGAPVDRGRDSQGQGWEKISDGGGIAIYRKEVPGSPIVAFRGEAIIDAPIAKVANVLIDTSRKREWVASIVDARNLKAISKFERVEYNRTAAPWPIQDRDFVFHAQAKFSREDRSARFVLRSTEDPQMPPVPGVVRGNLLESAYTLRSLGDGSSTHVVVEIFADPMGSIPKWVVNLVQRSWPRKTLEGIRRQVAKADVTEHAEIKEFFAASRVVAEARQ